MVSLPMMNSEVLQSPFKIAKIVDATINVIRQPFVWANEDPARKPLVSSSTRRNLQNVVPYSLDIVNQAEEATNEKAIDFSKTLGAITGTGVLVEGLIVGWQSVPEFHNFPITVWAKTVQSLLTGLVGMAFTRKLVNEVSYRLARPVFSNKIEQDLHDWARSERINLPSN